MNRLKNKKIKTLLLFSLMFILSFASIRQLKADSNSSHSNSDTRSSSSDSVTSPIPAPSRIDSSSSSSSHDSSSSSSSDSSHSGSLSSSSVDTHSNVGSSGSSLDTRLSTSTSTEINHSKDASSTIELMNTPNHSSTSTESVSSALDKSALDNFINHGVDEKTVSLGSGERAAALASYKEAFGSLPTTTAEMADVLKIASGQLPSAVSVSAEKVADTEFSQVYKRQPNLNNNHDLAAVKIMAYGLRQNAENRNLNSESNALSTFVHVYKHAPSTTAEWNMVQAIAYSGAVR